MFISTPKFVQAVTVERELEVQKLKLVRESSGADTDLSRANQKPRWSWIPSLGRLRASRRIAASGL